MGYGDLKYSTRRRASDKVLGDKASNTAKNLKYDDTKEVLLLWFINILTKSLLHLQINLQQVVVLITNNKYLAEELHKTIIKKLKKRTVYSAFKDKIWSAHSASMQSITSSIKNLDFYYVLLIFFSKYAWFVPLKNKKGATIVNVFQKIPINQPAKQRYRQTKEVDFTIVLLKNG